MQDFFQSLWLRNSHQSGPESQEGTLIPLVDWNREGPESYLKVQNQTMWGEDSFRRILLRRGQVWSATSCVWTHGVFGLGRWTLPQIGTSLANPFRTYLVLPFSGLNRTTWTFGVAKKTHVLYGLFRHLFSSFPKIWAGRTWVSGRNSSYQARKEHQPSQDSHFQEGNGCFFTCSQEEHVYWWYSGYQCHAIHLLCNISLHTIIL